MDYFYCPPEHITSTTILIDGEEFSHLVHVMRKKEGDEIRVVDGEGTAYDVVLTEVKKKTAHGTIHRSYPGHHEPSGDVTIAVGILKNPSKFDFLVEKVTELGVKEIVPLRTERTIGSHAKTDRWQKLALAAMKQSGRSYLPRISPLTSIDDFIASPRMFDHKLLAHEKPSPAGEAVRFDLLPNQSMAILIGPEGGFTDEEVERCVASGYTMVFLGERRLRTETAAIVMGALAGILCRRQSTE
jgi:16S rRNA (uracil1498-N3)-methyltransferase